MSDKVLIERRLIEFAIAQIGTEAALKAYRKEDCISSDADWERLKKDLHDRDAAMDQYAEFEAKGMMPVGYYQLQEAIGETPKFKTERNPE